jgi:hypothetical protein
MFLVVRAHRDLRPDEQYILVTVHGTLKLENRNWKFGLYAFTRRKRPCRDEREHGGCVARVLLMNVFNFGPSFSTIAVTQVDRLETDHVK